MKKFSHLSGNSSFLCLLLLSLYYHLYLGTACSSNKGKFRGSKEEEQQQQNQVIQEGKSTKVVFWFTPWGEDFDISKFPNWAYPGIVFAYDVSCGLCESFLEEWFSRSKNWLYEFRKSGKTVFINFFSEKYSPNFLWRGFLQDVAMDERVLGDLKNILGEGENTFLGFSELTFCIISEKCFGELVEIYRKIKELFPKSKIFYYGSGGENIEKVVELSQKSNLDLAGIDIWELEIVSDGEKVKPASYLLEKIRNLASALGWGKIFIGEFGMRVDDKKAYEEPWNWEKEIEFSESADEKYYRSAFENLFVENSFKPSFFGIWAWNDGVFAVQNEDDVLKVIENFFK